MDNSRLDRTGGSAGIAFVIATVVAALLTGQPPGPEASNQTVQRFFIDHHSQVVLQGWLYALATGLVIWFAVAVRRLLHTAPGGRHLGDLFFVGTVAVAALSFVSMSIRIVAAGAAHELSASAVRAVGGDFSLVLLALCGFIVALAATGYAGCVFSHPMLPRWTGWLAVIAAVVNVVGTLSVFLSDGPFSIEGGWGTLLPVAATGVWYLGTSVSLFRAPRSPPRIRPGKPAGHNCPVRRLDPGCPGVSRNTAKLTRYQGSGEFSWCSGRIWLVPRSRAYCSGCLEPVSPPSGSVRPRHTTGARTGASGPTLGV
ncbi:hypothetical protein ACQ856_12610 [Mycolicibacterium psychrotolerans]|uniref:hypothetical protein n=1 Tax=Mycolicibacterium psychrotolerans TaxID=216929 RepID=UPI003D666FA2